jgi:hypothetical protein
VKPQVDGVLGIHHHRSCDQDPIRSLGTRYGLSAPTSAPTAAPRVASPACARIWQTQHKPRITLSSARGFELCRAQPVARLRPLVFT